MILRPRIDLRQSQKKALRLLGSSSCGAFGASMVEFGLLLGLISSICVVAVIEMGKAVTVTTCANAYAVSNAETYQGQGLNQLEYRPSCPTKCGFKGKRFCFLF